MDRASDELEFTLLLSKMEFDRDMSFK